MAFRHVRSEGDRAGHTPDDGGGSFVTPYFWIGIGLSVLAWALAMLVIHLLL